MCMILIVKNKMFMVFERMREMIGKQIRFVVGSSYEPSFCLCISSACNLAVPVRGAKECWTRAKVSENTKRRCRGIPRNENLLRSFMESWHHLIEKNEISHLLCLFVNPFTFKCNNSIHSMYWSKEKLPWELLWVGSTAHWPPLDLDEWGVSSQEEGRVVDDTTTHWSFDCFWLVDDIEWSLCAWVLPMKNLE